MIGGPEGWRLLLYCHAVMLLCGVRACGHRAQRFVSRPIHAIHSSGMQDAGPEDTGWQGQHHDDRTQDKGPNADGKKQPCSSSLCSALAAVASCAHVA